MDEAISDGFSEAGKRAVWDVLVEECAARERQWNEFRIHWPCCIEFRFMGDLGTGGKVYYDWYDGPRAWVACYPEDRTPERDASVARANERLAAVSGHWRVVIGSVGGYDLTGADTDDGWGVGGNGLLRDDRFDDYDTARAALEAIYVRWRSDSCEDCVARAAADEVWLARVPRGGEFVGEVEGDDHLLIRSDRVQVQDLWDERERIEAGS